MQLRKVFLVAAAAIAALSAAPVALEPLVVSGGGHFLALKNGQPFFWLGDTAWLLFSKLTREETLRYLDNRSAKGFTVIQVMGLNSRE